MVTEFQEQVYAATKMVPKGKVTTYKEIGDFVGVRSYRAIGQALNKNPFAPDVPCHRVVASNGHLHGFATGLSKKSKILVDEGLEIEENKIKNFSKVLFRF